jgi:hypothetical protein
VTTTAELLLIADRRRPRSKQREIGMSDLGSCRRRVGYKLAGTAPVNQCGSVQAVMGSAIHDMVADVLQDIKAPDDLVEHEVRFAGVLGHLDRYEAEARKVADTKTTSSRWLEHIKLNGPEQGHVWQVSCYGAALIAEGHPVEQVQLDYLARDTGEEWVWAERFDPRHVRDAFEWLAQIRDSEIGMLPRDHDPDSVFCQGCPFGGEDGGICWEGHVPDRDLLSVLFVEDPEKEKLADELWAARQEIKRLTAHAARLKGALDALRPEMGGRVQCGDRVLDFRQNPEDPDRYSLYFVSGPRKSGAKAGA